MNSNLESAPDDRARNRILWLSTLAFTLLFAVWLMFGVLGLKLKEDVALMLGDAAKGMSPAEIQAAIESRFEWLLVVSILAGALPRLMFGIWADAVGGRTLMVGLLLGCAVATLGVSYVTTYPQLLVCAALIGIAGNSFSVGVSWNSAWFPAEKKGTALGIFGAGNVGAAGTKLLVVLVPGVLTLLPVAGYWNGWIPGGWRIIPFLYAGLLVLMAGAILLFCPANDRKPGRGRPLSELLAPLRYVQVWRFSLYYVAVFGAYVALSAWLPSYYVRTYQLSLHSAALLTSLFIFPASLLRPLGGWLSDVYGPRTVTNVVLLGMTLSIVPLCFPRDMLDLSVAAFTACIVLLAVGMGIGKASVFKYIPNYYPKDVGAVGGLVGMLGALGGFVLPKLFGWLGRATAFPQAAFIALLILTVTCFVWLQFAIRAFRARQRASLAEAALVAMAAKE